MLIPPERATGWSPPDSSDGTVSVRRPPLASTVTYHPPTQRRVSWREDILCAAFGSCRWVVASVPARGGGHTGTEGEEIAAVVETSRTLDVPGGSMASGLDVRRILDHSSGVARRQRDVDDHGVTGIIGIDLPERAPDKLLVLAHCAERHALERRRLHARNHDSGDVCLGERRPPEVKAARDRCKNFCTERARYAGSSVSLENLILCSGTRAPGNVRGVNWTRSETVATSQGEYVRQTVIRIRAGPQATRGHRASRCLAGRGRFRPGPARTARGGRAPPAGAPVSPA